MEEPLGSWTKGGQVSFVGVGPGDEGLLTVRAVERLRQARVVLTDQGDRRALIERHCRPDVTVIDLGADADGVPLPGSERAVVVQQAASGGGLVVRLLDGEPATFVSLSEEILACQRQGVRVDLVPAVSRLTAVPAYAGISLIPPGGSSVHVLPADSVAGWDQHLDPTVSILIAGTPQEVLTALGRLRSAGRDPQTPVAITVAGTTLRQRTVIAALQDVDRAWRSAKVIVQPEDSALAMIGQGVGASEAASWFETRWLFGWRILLPRTKEQATEVVAALAGYGATATVVPTIGVEPPRTPTQVEKAVKGLVTGRYEWVCFTSANAVRALREKITEFGLDARAMAGTRIAAVGEETLESLSAWGIEADLRPTTQGPQGTQGLLAVWPRYDRGVDPINRVLVPRAEISTDTLVAGLQRIGWEVDDVTAYRTIRASPPPAEIREAIKSGRFDAVLFTSSATVRNLIGIAGKPHPSTVVACIGPATAKTAQEHGLRVDVIAQEPTGLSLVEALAGFADSLRGPEQDGRSAPVPPSRRRYRRAT